MKKLLLSLVFALVSSTTLASDSLTWPGLDVRGYDTLNALECYVANLHPTCQYGTTPWGTSNAANVFVNRCDVTGWPNNTTWHYTDRLTLSGSQYDGEIWIERAAIVAYVHIGPLTSTPKDGAVVLRTFTYTQADGSRRTCEVRRKYGVTFAVTDLF